MSGSFRNIIRIGDTSVSEPVENKILSIGLRPDGFVFSILDPKQFRYRTLEDFQLTADHPVENYFLHLKLFLEEHALLKAPFEQVHVSFFTPHLLLIPAEMYHDDDKETLYRFSAEVPLDHIIRSERLNNLGAYGIYSHSHELTELLNVSFDNYRLRHQGSALIESTLAANQLENWQVDVVLHVKPSYFEIILLDNQKVILYHSFEYRTFDDLLYYLFYVLEQFERDAASQKLLLIGEIGMDCASYQTLASLFFKVSFPERNDAYKYVAAFDKIPGHYYYNLLNLVLCG